MEKPSQARKEDCPQIEEELDAYLDMELDDQRAEAIEQHLAVCGDCTGRLEELSALVSKLQALPEPPLPRDFGDLVEARIKATAQAQEIAPAELAAPVQAGTAKVFQFPRPLLVAAAALALVVVGATFFGSPSSKAPIATVPDKSATQVAEKPALPVNVPQAVEHRQESSPAVAEKAVAPAPAPAFKPSDTPHLVAQSQGKSVPSLTSPAPLAVSQPAPELIAEYDDIVGDGIDDYGISTNEDGLYAIKL
ncbi:MAG: zf-HC2 domain-containing protein [Candidatus Obscuribacter sp.]|nr:zf-HC2 domain-containing protein [Candidatus Obscuribacter sp.]